MSETVLEIVQKAKMSTKVLCTSFGLELILHCLDLDLNDQKTKQKVLQKKRIFYCTSLKSTEYKKLAQNALRFTFWNLKSCISHEKNETNSISFQFFTHRFNIFILFFTWFSRFQILISELQSIWQMLLVLSWLYLIV